MYGLFWVFTVFSFAFLILGASVNPTLRSLITRPPTLTTEYGFTQFEMPQIVNSEEPKTVFVSYNVTGYEPISEGDTVQVVVTVDFPLNLQYTALHVDVRPDNAFMVIFYPASSPEPSRPTPSIIWTTPIVSSNSQGQMWYGNVLVELAAAGVFGATVDVTVIPVPWDRNATSGPILQTTMPFHDQIETITIAPRGSAQQQLYENQDLSLTLFILFFASVDIAVAFYDHSYEIVATNNNGASQKKPKNRKDTLTEEIPPPIVNIIKRQKGGKDQAKTYRRYGKSKKDQRKKV